MPIIFHFYFENDNRKDQVLSIEKKNQYFSQQASIL